MGILRIPCIIPSENPATISALTIAPFFPCLALNRKKRKEIASTLKTLLSNRPQMLCTALSASYCVQTLFCSNLSYKDGFGFSRLH